MKVHTSSFPGLIIIEPRVFKDSRGYFLESYNQETFKEHGVDFNPVQDNESSSSYGVIRGLHFQKNPMSQSKLVRVIEGEIYDVALDLRADSPSFGKWYGIHLSSANKKQLLIPRGFAHGFSVLSDKAVILYKCDNFYSPGHEGGIIYNDPSLAIDWKIKPGEEIISEKDMKNSCFDDIELNFKML